MTLTTAQSHYTDTTVYIKRSDVNGGLKRKSSHPNSGAEDGSSSEGITEAWIRNERRWRGKGPPLSFHFMLKALNLQLQQGSQIFRFLLGGGGWGGGSFLPFHVMAGCCYSPRYNYMSSVINCLPVCLYCLPMCLSFYYLSFSKKEL